jgi:hypothetical protein
MPACQHDQALGRTGLELPVIEPNKGNGEKPPITMKLAVMMPLASVKSHQVDNYILAICRAFRKMLVYTVLFV